MLPKLRGMAIYGILEVVLYPHIKPLLGVKKVLMCEKENDIRISENAKRPKITFQGPILVPEVAFWGFWGLVCIEKWS